MDTQTALQPAQDLVVNLSSKTLSDTEKRVLNLGLGFGITTRYNDFQDCIDLFLLIWQSKLRTFFGMTTTVEKDPFKACSTLIPNVSEPAIIMFEMMVLKDLEKLEKSKRFS